MQHWTGVDFLFTCRPTVSSTQGCIGIKNFYLTANNAYHLLSIIYRPSRTKKAATIYRKRSLARPTTETPRVGGHSDIQGHFKVTNFGTNRKPVYDFHQSIIITYILYRTFCQISRSIYQTIAPDRGRHSLTNSFSVTYENIAAL